MQVGGKNAGSREKSFSVFSLALAEKLFPPFAHHLEARFIADKDFDLLALAVKDIADGGVAVAVVFLKIRVVELLLGGCGAFHQRGDVGAGNRDGKQADGSEDRIAPAHVVRNDESLVALARRQRLEGAARLVGRAVDALRGARLAVFLFQQAAEDAERHGRLRRGAGFGDHVDGNVFTLADFQHIGERGRADAVAHEINIRRILLQRVVILGTEKFDGRAGAEVRAADADNDENPGIGADLPGGGLDAGEFLPVVIFRKGNPPEKIVAEARAGMERIMRQANLRGYARILVLADKIGKITRVKPNRHDIFLLIAFYRLFHAYFTVSGQAFQGGNGLFTDYF